VLEDADIPPGVVTGALGQRWYGMVMTGQEAHAGPTPMALRRDALQGDTVSYVQVHPNSRNMIPGRVTFTVDFRHGDDAGLSRMDQRLRAACAALGEAGGLEVAIAQTVCYPPARFAAPLVAAVREGARRMGLAHLDIVSGAGHDAVYVARTAPAAMIFVPCKDGILHNEIEDTKPEHLAAGANVLLHAMLDQAGIA
jgi:N-carbamoyl-L-amino-acid hydrolase